MKKHSAFSLIELSIVILIIGILIAGTVQASRLVNQAKLKTARTLTKSSSVNGISDLILWYETSLESSFDTTVQNDGDSVSTWYDNNQQSAQKINATTAGNNPTYYTNIFNGGIPAVRFASSSSLYVGSSSSDTNFGSMLVGNGYTIFVVEQKRSSSAPGYFFGGATTASTMYFGYSSDTAVTLAQTSSNTVSGTVSSYTSPTTRVHTAMFDKTATALAAGLRYWLNGGDSDGDATPTATTTTLTAAFAATLGTAAGASSSFVGDLAEVIVFNRALKTEERLAIESYLGKKYGITMATS